jgi:hypothetical protein
MTAEGNELQFILDAVARLGREVEAAEPGAPELAVVVATVHELQRRLERVRAVMGPLVADAKREPSLDERAAASLERALASLLRAAEAKQDLG